jgi:GNAT superfamily N-acetyltransferase
MADDYQIAYVDTPELAAWGIIGRGIRDFNTQQAGDDRAQRLCFAVFGPGDEIVGGVIGVVYWDWLYIDLMWVREDLRGRGFGHRLLELLEEEAREQGARQVYLDTFSFQAPEFYKRHGYRVFGELKDFPAGHDRFFMTKQLSG